MKRLHYALAALTLIASCQSRPTGELVDRYPGVSTDADRAVLLRQLNARPKASNALAVYQDALRRPDSEVRLLAVQGLRRFGLSAADELVAAMADPDPAVAAEGQKGVRELGDAAAGPLSRSLKVALPEDGVDWTMTSSQRTAFEMLTRIGAAALPELRYALEDPETVLGAAELIRRIGPPAAPAVRDLRGALRLVKHPAQIMAVVEALGAVGEKAAPASEQLRSLLGKATSGELSPDPETSLRLQVALVQALGNVVADEAGRKDTAEHIAGYLRPEMGAPLRRAAAVALGQLGVTSTLPKLAEAAQDDPDGEVRLFAVDALGIAGGNASAHLELLASILSAEDPELRKAAMRSIAQIGGSAAPMKLAPALADGENRNAAISAFAKLGSASVPVLREGVLDRETRRTSLLSLQALGPAAAGAVEDLIDVLRTQPGQLRTIAADALAAVGEPAITPLLDRMIAGSSDGEEAQRALAKIGSPAVPALVACFGKDDPLIELQARAVLEDMGRRAVPALLEALADPDTRQPVVKTLGMIGREAKPAIESLRALADQDASLRPDVVAALRRIEPTLFAPKPTPETGANQEPTRRP